MGQEFCKRCGYPLGRRPRLYEKDGLCGACINDDIKKLLIGKLVKINLMKLSSLVILIVNIALLLLYLVVKILR